MAASSAHGCAIEFVGRSTDETDLVVLAFGASMWPGKFMAAKQLQESGEQWRSHGVGILCVDEVTSP